MKQVDFNRDIAPLLPVMIGAYEKANIHAPYNTSKDASEILSNEVEEALEEIKKIEDIVICESKNFSFNILDTSDLQIIQAHAISGICELLQVMAVCKKYEQLLERE